MGWKSKHNLLQFDYQSGQDVSVRGGLIAAQITIDGFLMELFREPGFVFASLSFATLIH